jgi:hypothetical protein
VDFLLETNSQVKFDFIFGSVEYPFWTSDFTDALLVFLDGTDPTNQIATDANGQPVQVGISFSGLVTSSDQNTAFADPHGLLRKLTTTTAMLPAGPHTIRFEVGDVNDQLLDSAAFIANLRAGAGIEGTGLADPPPVLSMSGWRAESGTNYLQLSWTNSDVSVVLESADDVTGPWTETPLVWTTNLNMVVATVTNNASRQFFRLREQ